jgi:hypothetical protein
MSESDLPDAARNFPDSPHQFPVMSQKIRCSDAQGIYPNVLIMLRISPRIERC